MKENKEAWIIVRVTFKEKEAFLKEAEKANIRKLSVLIRRKLGLK